MKLTVTFECLIYLLDFLTCFSFLLFLKKFDGVIIGFLCNFIFIFF
jgi:hypothetical protein